MAIGDTLGVVMQSDVARKFKSFVQYLPGDYVFYSDGDSSTFGELYICQNLHEGTWDANDFLLVGNVGEALYDTANIIAHIFYASEIYQPGQLVIYHQILYECIAEHHGEWDATHFDRCFGGLGDKIVSLNNAQLPVITKQPESVYLEIYSGATYNATMSVEVSGVGPFTYQWQARRPIDSDWADSSLGGNKTNTLQVNQNNSAGEGFQFRCKVTNANGTVYSEPATINPYRSFASPFGEHTAYSVGNYCTQRGTLYRCTTAHEGAWDASHFTAVSVGGDIVNYLPTLFAPKVKDFIIQNGATKSFNIANSSRIFLVLISPNQLKNDLILISATNSGNITLQNLNAAATDLTITTSQNLLTIAAASTGSGVSVYAQVFNGGITEITT